MKDYKGNLPEDLSSRKAAKDRALAWLYGRRDEEFNYVVIDDIGVIDLDPADWREVPILKELPAGEE